jgi:hypothetical protein
MSTGRSKSPIDLVVEEPARFVLSRVEKWSDGTANEDIKDPELLIEAHNVADKKAKELLRKGKRRENLRAWRKAHPEEVAAANLSWKKDNPEKVKESKREWQRVYRAANRDKICERKRIFRAKKKAERLAAEKAK